MIDRTQLPRQMLPRGELELSSLPEYVPQYSGDLQTDDDQLPRSVHMAFAIALTNVDQYMAFEDTKRDTVDALVQAWRAVSDADDVTVEYSRSATSVDVERSASGSGRYAAEQD